MTNPVQTAYYFDSPVALIIGCGDMGMGCARVLGRRRPLVLVDIDAERLAQSVSTLQTEGYRAIGQQCDITEPGRVAELASLVAAGPGVKVLAHVAAIAGATIPWRKLMGVDLLGAHHVARAMAPYMVAGGVAILISSTGSYQCPANAAIDALLDDPLQHDFMDKLEAELGSEPHFLEAYFLAKQGINRLAQRLAIEWGGKQVRAVSVSPGLIDSTMGRTGGKNLPVYNPGGEPEHGSREEKAVREVPLGRQGTVLEITAVVEFLASEAASFINGVDVPVDGGSTALRRQRGIVDR